MLIRLGGYQHLGAADCRLKSGICGTCGHHVGIKPSLCTVCHGRLRLPAAGPLSLTELCWLLQGHSACVTCWMQLPAAGCRRPVPDGAHAEAARCLLQGQSPGSSYLLPAAQPQPSNALAGAACSLLQQQSSGLSLPAG